MKLTVEINENQPEFYDPRTKQFDLGRMAIGLVKMAEAIAVNGALAGEFRDPRTMDSAIRWTLSDYDCLDESKIIDHEIPRQEITGQPEADISPVLMQFLANQRPRGKLN